VIFSPDGKTLSSCGREGSIQFWDVAPSERPISSLSWRSGRLRFLPDGTYAQAHRESPTNNWIGFYDTATGALRRKLQRTNGIGGFLSFQNHLVIENEYYPREGQERISLDVYDLTTQHLITNIMAKGQHLLALSTTGKTLASWFHRRNPGVIHFIDTTSWQEVSSMELPSGALPQITFLHDHPFFNDRMLAFGRANGGVDVFDLRSGKPLASFRAHRGRCSNVAFSPNERLLATCSEDGEVKLWDTTTWTVKAALGGHLLGVFSVAFSADGRRLATGSAEGEAVKLWDVATGQEIASLAGRDFCLQVMFSPDGRAIAAHTQDGSVNLWRASTWPQIEAAEKLIRHE
jgi:WD40 repeat protein